MKAGCHLGVTLSSHHRHLNAFVKSRHPLPRSSALFFASSSNAKWHLAVCSVEVALKEGKPSWHWQSGNPGMPCLLLCSGNREKSGPAKPTPHARLIDRPFCFPEFSLANCFVVPRHNQLLSRLKILKQHIFTLITGSCWSVGRVAWVGWYYHLQGSGPFLGSRSIRRHLSFWIWLTFYWDQLFVANLKLIQDYIEATNLLRYYKWHIQPNFQFCLLLPGANPSTSGNDASATYH